MIDICRAADCLTDIIAYRQSANGCLSTLDADLIDPSGTSSCIYINDEPGINQDVIEAAMSADYADVSEYLRAVRTSEIQNALQAFINQHKELTRSRTLLDNLDVVKHMTYFADKVTVNGRFVGIEIKPANSQSITAIIKSLGVQFDSLQAGLPIYFFETSQETAIETYSLTNTKTNSLQWFTMTDFEAKYKYADGGTGQSYIVGYFENDLVGQAVDTKLYGNCCGNTWVGDYQNYALVRGVAFGSSALSGTDIPNMRQISYTDQTFGLHLKITIECDITDTICDNVNLFAQLCKKKVALRIMWDFYNNMNLNRKAELSRDRALPNITRLEKEFADELKGIKLDLTDIDKVCMPCNKNFISSTTMR
jgi:hypothetical protein